MILVAVFFYTILFPILLAAILNNRVETMIVLNRLLALADLFNRIGSHITDTLGPVFRQMADAFRQFCESFSKVKI